MSENDFVNPSISLSADECELLLYYDKAESTFCLWSQKDGELLNFSVEEALKFSEFAQHASTEETTNSGLLKSQTFEGLSDEKNITNEQPTKYQQRMEKLKSEFPNAYAKWTSEEEQILKKIWKETGSIEAISNALGRHKGSIRSRLGKLGLDALSSQFEQQDKGDHELIEDTSGIISSLDENETYCRECGLVIPVERINALPDTKLCVDCASDPNFKKQKVSEPWGSREEYKKDRKSWLHWRRD